MADRVADAQSVGGGQRQADQAGGSAGGNLGEDRRRAGHLDQVADRSGQAGHEQVQAEQLGDAAQLERAHGLEGALAENGGQGAHARTSRRRSIAVSTRRSSTWPSASTIGVGRGERRVGDDHDAVVGEAGRGGAWATVGCRRTRGVAAAGQDGEHAAYGVGAGVLGEGQLAADQLAGELEGQLGRLRVDPGGQLGQGLVEAGSRLLERGDGGAVLGLAAGLGGGAPLRGLLGGQAGGLVGLAAALGPAHGVPLRRWRRRGCSRRAWTGSAR